jgi:hypothetical protein
MFVRVRWSKRRNAGIARHRVIALGLASLLTPSALAAFTMAFWSMGADLSLTGDFVISTGLLSHWQVWLAAAGVLLLFARLLNRFGGGQQEFGEGDREAVS